MDIKQNDKFCMVKHTCSFIYTITGVTKSRFSMSENRLGLYNWEGSFYVLHIFDKLADDRGIMFATKTIVLFLVVPCCAAYPVLLKYRMDIFVPVQSSVKWCLIYNTIFAAVHKSVSFFNSLDAVEEHSFEQIRADGIKSKATFGDGSMHTPFDLAGFLHVVIEIPRIFDMEI